jgi:hypothetical protein
VVNRPGTQFVKEVKDSTKDTRLIEFSYSDDQTFAIEMGNLYMRFHTSGATLLAGSTDGVVERNKLRCRRSRRRVAG